MIKEEQSKTAIRGYGLDFPSVGYTLSALERFMDVQEAHELWENVCKKCNISANTTDLNELETAYKELSNHKGRIRVLGRSLVIRLVAYRALRRKKDA